MAKTAKRQKQLASKRAKREARNRSYREGTAIGNSNYARKVAYLDAAGLWGFEVPDKPWKGGKTQ